MWWGNNSSWTSWDCFWLIFCWNKGNNCCFTDFVKKNTLMLACIRTFKINLIWTWYDNRYYHTLHVDTSRPITLQVWSSHQKQSPNHLVKALRQKCRIPSSARNQPLEMLQNYEDWQAETPTIILDIPGIQAKDHHTDEELRSLTLEALKTILNWAEHSVREQLCLLEMFKLAVRFLIVCLILASSCVQGPWAGARMFEMSPVQDMGACFWLVELFRDGGEETKKRLDSRSTWLRFERFNEPTVVHFVHQLARRIWCSSYWKPSGQS